MRAYRRGDEYCDLPLEILYVGRKSRIFESQIEVILRLRMSLGKKERALQRACLSYL
jgi:hypothetical protein